nr:LOW QUALITY PROTEIN: peptidyl-prolyl cis-trans isomerase G-like [Cherax quadricarinatus]
MLLKRPTQGKPLTYPTVQARRPPRSPAPAMDLYGVALNGAYRIFVKLLYEPVYEKLVEQFQDLCVDVSPDVHVRMVDVSRQYTSWCRMLVIDGRAASAVTMIIWQQSVGSEGRPEGRPVDQRMTMGPEAPLHGRKGDGGHGRLWSEEIGPVVVSNLELSSLESPASPVVQQASGEDQVTVEVEDLDATIASVLLSMFSSTDVVSPAVPTASAEIRVRGSRAAEAVVGCWWGWRGRGWDPRQKAETKVVVEVHRVDDPVTNMEKDVGRGRKAAAKKHVVFGRVVSGQEVVVAIENLPVDNRSRPLQPAVIANCGELVLQRSSKLKAEKKHKKKENVASSDSDSDSEKKKKKKKKKKKEKKQKHKKTESSGEEGEVKDDTSEGGDQAKYCSHPLVSVSVINPDEIPDVPKNRFLYRAGPEKDGDNEGRQDRGRERSRATVRAYTKSGRKVKGRGSLRYHTPSPSRSRSRSRTPPHWRQAQRRTISYDQLQKWNEEKVRREQERLLRQEEREQEIEERRRRREQRHREMEEVDGKDGENNKRGESFQREQGMKSDWRDPRDKLRKDFREGRNQQVWRNGRDRQRGEPDWRDGRERTRTEEDWREGRNKEQWNDRREEIGHQDLREKLRSQREKLESSINDKLQRDEQDSDDHPYKREKAFKKEKQDDPKEKHDSKREKQEVFDETALDYEAMDNEEEEEEEETGDQKKINGRINEDEPIGRNPSPKTKENGELKEEKVAEDKDHKKEKGLDQKRGNKEQSGRSRSRERKDKDNSKSHDKPKDRSRDRRGRSHDRGGRNREKHNKSRDRRNRSKERRDRSRDRNSRRDRSRDRSRDRRDRSRDRRSRSKDKARERKRHRSKTSSSDSD